MLGVLLLALTLTGCALGAPPGPSPEQPARAPSTKDMTVTGMLTGEGVECQAMRGEDGTLYTLTGDLSGFRTGDRVRVTGSVAEVSVCMQGTTIAVKKIERAK